MFAWGNGVDGNIKNENQGDALGIGSERLQDVTETCLPTGRLEYYHRLDNGSRMN